MLLTLFYLKDKNCPTCICVCAINTTKSVIVKPKGVGLCVFLLSKYSLKKYMTYQKFTNCHRFAKKERF